MLHHRHICCERYVGGRSTSSNSKAPPSHAVVSTSLSGCSARHITSHCFVPGHHANVQRGAGVWRVRAVVPACIVRCADDALAARDPLVRRIASLGLHRVEVYCWHQSACKPFRGVNPPCLADVALFFVLCPDIPDIIIVQMCKEYESVASHRYYRELPTLFLYPNGSEVWTKWRIFQAQHCHQTPTTSLRICSVGRFNILRQLHHFNRLVPRMIATVDSSRNLEFFFVSPY